MSHSAGCRDNGTPFARQHTVTPAHQQPNRAETPAIAGSVGSVKLLGVPVRFHFTFILLLIFLTVVGIGNRQSGLMYVVFILGLFASVLLHELGHATVAKHYGIRTVDITMFPIGGVSRLEKQPKPKEELWIALGGPFVNLVIAGALFGWLYYTGQIANVADLREPTDANLLQRIAGGNLVLCLFNLLPAFPMDGGRILRAVIARFRSEERATAIAAATGRMLAILLGLVGLLTAQFMLVFIAFFVYLGAAQEGAAVARTQSHPGSSGTCRDDHGLPDTAARQYGAGRREPPAGHLTAGLSRHARRSGDRLLPATA